MIVRSFVMRSCYQDSLVLMRIAQELRSQPGVEQAAALMGTPSNHEVLAAAGLSTPESADAKPGDLILAVGASDGAAADAALQCARDRFSVRAKASVEQARSRSLERALFDQPQSNLAMISVPGEHARLEAMRALRRGLHVFLFSDNVPIADEIALKRYSVGRGLLCMGPDCGTAYLSGVGIGFANVVPRGPISIIAASGTGLQAVASGVANLGSGIHHGIGVGGRDLSAEVGGLMTFAALDLLDRDPGTSLIVLVSKPPAASMLPQLQERLARLTKPAVVCCLGATAPASSLPGVDWMDDLAATAAMAVARLQKKGYVPRAFQAPELVREMLDMVVRQGAVAGKTVLGLYVGGTLATEAKLILRALIGQVDGSPPAGDNDGHHVVDLGDDEFTKGKPHPMLAPETRAERLLTWTEGTAVGVVLLDCVLGRVGHADPLGVLLTEIAKARERASKRGTSLQFVASVTGTDGDPQSASLQRKRLADANVAVLDSNAEAARFAALIVRPDLRARLLES
jgi:FdrA protein